jgi:hypothetical protein
MAREGYSSSPPPEPYPYEQPDSNYSRRASYLPGSTFQTAPSYERSRPQDTASVQNEAYRADPTRYQQARQPIDDAVSSAFRGTENASALSPEMIDQITSQITANVLQQLRTSNLSPPANNAAGSTSSAAPGSPPVEHRTVYTPPSPTRPSDDHIPPPPTSPTLLAAQPRPFDPNQVRYSPPLERHTTSPLSQGSQADGPDHKDERAERGYRPKGPRRLSTSQDPTLLEKIWGTLFDDKGQVTPRLGQFLRGIATHLIEDYEPQNSLVVTPLKMQKYYEATKVSAELLPFDIIFDDHTSSISRLYREIEAQHHLTQVKLDERPDTPGLTPLGFATWASLLIRAYPEQEFERLQKTVLEMPISNPDDRKERFPKEISRRLFPMHPDHKIRDKLEKAMATHCSLKFPSSYLSAPDSQQPNAPMQTRAESSAPPVPNPAPLSQSARDGGLLSPVSSRPSQPPPPPPLGTSVERGHQQYAAMASESAVEDTHEDAVPPPQPIERERKPYVAQPGGGKNYDEVNRPPSPPDYMPPPPTTRPARSGSIVSHGRANDIPRSRPIPISIHQRAPGPPPEAQSMPDSATASHHRSNSMYHQQHPHPATRNRSPSATANGRGYERSSQGDLSYGSYQSSTDDDNSRGYPAYEKSREKYANDRYDASRMKAYDPHEREREREVRQRFQTTVGVDGPKAPYAVDDQYYRPVSGYPQTTVDGYPAYPASTYR